MIRGLGAATRERAEIDIREVRREAARGGGLGAASTQERAEIGIREFRPEAAVAVGQAPVLTQILEDKLRILKRRMLLNMLFEMCG